MLSAHRASAKLYWEVSSRCRSRHRESPAERRTQAEARLKTAEHGSISQVVEAYTIDDMYRACVEAEAAGVDESKIEAFREKMMERVRELHGRSIDLA